MRFYVRAASRRFQLYTYCVFTFSLTFAFHVPIHVCPPAQRACLAPRYAALTTCKSTRTADNNKRSLCRPCTNR